MGIHVRRMILEDWPRVAAIYREGMETGLATFETSVPGWDAWNEGHHRHSRLIATEADAILGWAALGPVSRRAAYAGVAEVTVYVAPEARGRGVGSTLLEALIESSEAETIWTLQASIFPENHASLRLHEKQGFRIVGRRERIAQRNGVWRDTLLLERRSG